MGVITFYLCIACTALLNIQTFAELLSLYGNQNISIRFSCDEKFSYWEFRNVTENKFYSIVENSTIKIDSLTPSNAGTYRCVHGSDSSCMELVLVEDPHCWEKKTGLTKAQICCEIRYAAHINPTATFIQKFVDGHTLILDHVFTVLPTVNNLKGLKFCLIVAILEDDSTHICKITFPTDNYCATKWDTIFINMHSWNLCKRSTIMWLSMIIIIPGIAGITILIIIVKRFHKKKLGIALPKSNRISLEMSYYNVTHDVKPPVVHPWHNQPEVNTFVTHSAAFCVKDDDSDAKIHISTFSIADTAYETEVETKDNTEDEAEETSSDKDYCSCELTETNFLTT